MSEIAPLSALQIIPHAGYAQVFIDAEVNNGPQGTEAFLLRADPLLM